MFGMYGIAILSPRGELERGWRRAREGLTKKALENIAVFKGSC